jgi:anthranilate synthase/aminodeoxychorismate synthase-like glutamine amidotransferase
LTMLLVIDNYDSFAYNLVQYLGELDAEPTVRRNDAVTVADVLAGNYSGIVISPGPGTPRDAGVSLEIIRRLSGVLPIFGVCLGHQAIGEAFGGQVVRAPKPVHGKASEVTHDGCGVFEGVPQPLAVGRYHSLMVERETLPAELQVTAETRDGHVMGVRHKRLAVEGVQFHPESVLTSCGKQMLANFVRQCSVVHSAVAVVQGSASESRGAYSKTRDDVSRSHTL